MYSYDPYQRINDLLDYIDELEHQLETERSKANEYLSKWISAQDTAAWRNVQLCAGMKPKETE